MHWRGLQENPGAALRAMYVGEAKAVVDAEEREAEQKRMEREQDSVDRMRAIAIQQERAEREKARFKAAMKSIEPTIQSNCH